MAIQSPSTAERIHTLVTAITEWYLEHGTDCTVKEIATSLGWSESTVRAYLPATTSSGVRARQDYRQSYSKNYRSFESGQHKVWVYGPSREQLAQLVKDLRVSVRAYRAFAVDE